MKIKSDENYRLVQVLIQQGDIAKQAIDKGLSSREAYERVKFSHEEVVALSGLVQELCKNIDKTKLREIFGTDLH